MKHVVEVEWFKKIPMLSTTVIKMEDLPLPSLQPAHDIMILCISMTLCKENVQEVILRGNENTSGLAY